MVWNRLRYIKDPDTGKRVSRMNPKDEWVVKEVPEMCIIDQKLWDQVKVKQGKINKKNTPLWQKNRPKNLFSYLLKCGCCGGGYSMISGSHIGCSKARNKGTCDNRITMKREDLERAVLGALRNHLMDEKLCAEFCKEYTCHVNELRNKNNASLYAYQDELKKLDIERNKIIDSIVAGVPGEQVKDRMIEIGERTEEIKAIISHFKEARVVFHPSMAQRYHEEVQGLIKALSNEDSRMEAANILRTLIDRIVLTPSESKDRTMICYGITETTQARLDQSSSCLSLFRVVVKRALSLVQPHCLEV